MLSRASYIGFQRKSVVVNRLSTIITEKDTDLEEEMIAEGETNVGLAAHRCSML